MAVNQDDLVMVLLDAALMFGTGNSIGFLLEPQILSSAIDFVIKEKVADKICTSNKIERVARPGRTVFFFGAGCLAYGKSQAYVVTDLGGFSECVQKIRF